MLEKNVDKCQRNSRKNKEILFFNCLVANAAERFFGNAEIRCNNMLRKPIYKFGILLSKISVSLFGRVTDRRIHSFLKRKSILVVKLLYHFTNGRNPIQPV